MLTKVIFEVLNQNPLLQTSLGQNFEISYALSGFPVQGIRDCEQAVDFWVRVTCFAQSNLSSQKLLRTFFTLVN